MTRYSEWATDNCDPADMFDAPEVIVVGNQNRTEECGNCGHPRNVSEDGYVETCKVCGDDEFNIHEYADLWDYE